MWQQENIKRNITKRQRRSNRSDDMLIIFRNASYIDDVD